MTGLVFTTAEEAGDFLDRIGATRTGDMRSGALSEGDRTDVRGAIVAVLGVGKIKATLNTERLLQARDVERVVHVGSCMALSDAFDVGTLVGASFVLEGDRVQLDAPSYPRMPLDTPYATDATCTMVTQDHDIGNDEEQSYWQKLADVNDTSSYAVAYVAAQHGIPCYVAKVVTSQAGVDSDSFLEDRKHAQERIAAFLQEEVLPETESTGG
jgi:nucleoside phosphorylase